MKMLLPFFYLVFVFAGCNNADNNATPDPTYEPTQQAVPPTINYSVIKTYPHDLSYFTEGFEFHNNQLLESSGGNEEESPYPSEMGSVNLSTGKVTTKVKLDRQKYFGEGITVFGNTLYMLTYKSKIGFKYDATTYKLLGQFDLPSKEGWGLTHDTASLIMSDGTNSLIYLDPKTLQVKNIVGITDQAGPVANLNELEYVDGFIYANQWLTPYILKIDPNSGKVVGRIDLSKLDTEVTEKYKDTYGLNGIAYDAAKGTFFVTGKKWPTIYEIKLQ